MQRTPDKRDPDLPQAMRDPQDHPGSTEPAAWLAAPAVAILAVVCCAGPLLIAALVATGAGAWLAAHGYTVGAIVVIALAVVLAWSIRRKMARG